MNLKQLNEKLRMLLEDSKQDETSTIFQDLASKGFKCIGEYIAIFETEEDWDEDGPSLMRGRKCDDEFNDSIATLNNYRLDSPIEYVIILGDGGTTTESDEYPTGGTPDNITYSTAWTQYSSVFFFMNEEKNGINAAKYVVENYPDSKLAEYIKLTEADTMEVEEYNDIVHDVVRELDDDYFD